jgi:hypothetical protein
VTVPSHVGHPGAVDALPSALIALIVAGGLTTFYCTLFRTHPDHHRNDPLWPEGVQAQGSDVRFFAVLFAGTAVLAFVALILLG